MVSHDESKKERQQQAVDVTCAFGMFVRHVCFKFVLATFVLRMYVGNFCVSIAIFQLRVLVGNFCASNVRWQLLRFSCDFSAANVGLLVSWLVGRLLGL